MRVEDAFNLRICDNFGCDFDDSCNEDFFGDLPEQLDAEDEIAWGISKFVIFPAGTPDKVIKIPFEGGYFHLYTSNSDDYEVDFCPNTNIVDYCEEEADIYTEAEELGLECFFAETKFGGHTKDGTPFYVSERILGYEPNEETSQDSYKKAEENRCALPQNFVADAIEQFGLEKVQELIVFLKAKNLHDFHDGNIGVRRDGSVCILDYSDWREDF